MTTTLRELTEDERRTLDFCGRHYNTRGAQETDIYDEFDGISATRFWLRVNRLLDDPAALAYAPTTVRRLQRLRARRQRKRSARHIGIELS